MNWGEIKEYFAGGLAAHGIYFSILCAVFLYSGTRQMTKVELFLYFMSIFSIFLYGTRGWMFITILSSIYLRGLVFNIWSNKILILLSPVLGIGFMVVSYFYRNFTGNVDASLIEIFEHVMGYFVAGVQGANSLFVSNLPNDAYNNLVFNGIDNVIILLLDGEYVSNSTPYFFTINDSGMLSNVTTIFGTILYGLNIYIYWFFLFIFY